MQINFSNLTIFVVGDVMLDAYIMGKVQRLSPEAPVPVVHVREKTFTLGGAGNAALNLSCLGCRTWLFGYRGADDNGERLSGMLGEKGIRDLLIVNQDHPTTTKTRVIGQGQQLLRLDEEAVWHVPEEVTARLVNRFAGSLDQADAVILSDYGKGIFADDLCSRLISLCREKRVPVFVDPKTADWRRYMGATCITPNAAEFENATGLASGMFSAPASTDADSTGIEAADQLRISDLMDKLSIDHLLVTLGARGMCLLSADRPPRHIPTRAREVFDVSGAGDTVIATLAASVASGMSFPEAAETANAAAGVVVGKLGTQPVYLSELQAATAVDTSGNTRGANLKIAALDAAVVTIKSWRASGQKIVFTNGCFDLLHPGHIHILNQARELGDRLVVGLNTDSSIRKIKTDNRPIVSEQDRAAVLSALSSVDMVILFDEETPINLIKAIKPDILVKGADYKKEDVVGRDIVESTGGRVELVPLLKGHSTTRIVNKLSRAESGGKNVESRT